MKTTKPVICSILTAFILVGWSVSAMPQFDSGSDGSYGPINITATTTLQVPEDGIFHATTVDIANLVNLGFIPNARNTPVYILATGDVNIGSGAAVHVNGSAPSSQKGGKGGPGGFDGGAASVAGAPAGDGRGPGGGRGGVADPGDPDYFGSGSYGTVSTVASSNNGATYGTNLLMPMVGGSGGGGSDLNSGGGGGGAITIASNTHISLIGSVQALGAGVGSNGHGSGGSVRLVAPKISGNGSIQVHGSGGMGRARVDLIDFSEYGVTFTGNPPHVVGKLMQVFPTTMPSLAIIEAAGESIPEGSTTPVDIFLPDGSSPTQDVIVQARDFTGIVPIRVKVTPDSGDSVAYDDTIDMSGGNPSTVTVSVNIPVNQPVFIEAWTTSP